MNDMMLEGDDEAALRRRYQELAKEFEERHPAKSAANKFVNGLFEASRIREGVISSRADREAARSGDELFVRYGIICDLFESAQHDLSEFIFSLMLKVMRASYELGIHAAPDGRAARAAREGSGDSKFINLVSIVNIYCREHGLEPKASEKFARVIRPDVLELYGKPKDAPSKIYPSLAAIVTALRAVRKSSFTL
jgi:hypothetical protein